MNYEDVMKMLTSLRNFALLNDSRVSTIEELVLVTEDTIVKNKFAMHQSIMDDLEFG